MYKGDPGGVMCSAGGRDIAFPTLYRVVQTLSAEEEFGLGPVEGYVHFTIHGEADRDTIPGTQFRAPVLGLLGCCDGPSLVIRWHPNRDHYEGYRTAVTDIAGIDAGGDTQRGLPMGEACETGDGIFTAEWRDTDPRWPAPLVIYIASVPLSADHPAAGLVEADWYAAFTPDGGSATVSYLDPRPE
jgi:hypothetical protein